MNYGIYDGIFKLREIKEIPKFSVLKEAESEEEGYEWRVTFYLPKLGPEYDDDFDEFKEEVIVKALDVDQALKYAEQYIRVQQKDNANWKDAEVLSIERM